MADNLSDCAGVSVEEGGIGCGIMPGTEDTRPNQVTFYTQVGDLQACLGKAERLGGKTVAPPILDIFPKWIRVVPAILEISWRLE